MRNVSNAAKRSIFTMPNMIPCVVWAAIFGWMGNAATRIVLSVQSGRKNRRKPFFLKAVWKKNGGGIIIGIRQAVKQSICAEEKDIIKYWKIGTRGICELEFFENAVLRHLQLNLIRRQAAVRRIG